MNKIILIIFLLSFTACRTTDKNSTASSVPKVKKHQTVILTFEGERLQVQLVAKALESGRDGDTICLLNVKSGKIVRGQIKGPNECIVSESSPLCKHDHSLDIEVETNKISFFNKFSSRCKNAFFEKALKIDDMKIMTADLSNYENLIKELGQPTTFKVVNEPFYKMMENGFLKEMGRKKKTELVYTTENYTWFFQYGEDSDIPIIVWAPRNKTNL